MKVRFSKDVNVKNENRSSQTVALLLSKSQPKRSGSTASYFYGWLKKYTYIAHNRASGVDIEGYVVRVNHYTTEAIRKHTSSPLVYWFRRSVVHYSNCKAGLRLNTMWFILLYD